MFPIAVTHSSAEFLLEVGLVLLVLAVLARLAVRTGFSPIPLYLLAGLGLGHIAPGDLDPLFVDIQTQLAIMLLLFMLGLEYAADDLVDGLRAGVGSGLVDFVLNFPPGFVAALLLGWGVLPGLVLGGVTYITSSGIVAKVVEDFGWLGNSETRPVLAVLVIEDLSMAPYLPLLAVLMSGGNAWRGIGLAVAVTALAAAAIFVSRRYGPRLTSRLQHPKGEVVLLTVVGLLLVAGAAGELLGAPSAVLAFLVGLSISGALAERTRELLSPLRDLFAALFFVLFGLQIDVGKIPSVLGVAAVLLVVTAATKLLTGWYAARKTSDVAGRLRAGTALVARGEFSIVIVGLALSSGLEPALAPLAATYVLFTAIGGALMTRYADRAGRWYERRRPGKGTTALDPGQDAPA